MNVNNYLREFIMLENVWFINFCTEYVETV